MFTYSIRNNVVRTCWDFVIILCILLCFQNMTCRIFWVFTFLLHGIWFRSWHSTPDLQQLISQVDTLFPFINYMYKINFYSGYSGIENCHTKYKKWLLCRGMGNPLSSLPSLIAKGDWLHSLGLSAEWGGVFFVLLSVKGSHSMFYLLKVSILGERNPKIRNYLYNAQEYWFFPRISIHCLPN